MRKTKPLRILVAEGRDFSIQAVALLQKVGILTVSDLDRSGLLAAVQDFDILWVRLRNRIDEEIMGLAKQLRIIATPTTGLNHIDLKTAEKRGITVLSLRGEDEFLNRIRATAELTVGLTISLLRKIPAASQHAIACKWNRDLFKGTEISEKIVGIVGYGRLGKIVAKYFLAFGANVLVADPYVQKIEVNQGEQLVPMTTLLSNADIISLHVNLTDATKKMFDRHLFQSMKPGAYFINTARGELVEEAALLSALESGQLAGAALDVLCGELDKIFQKNILIKYAEKNDNLILTPHIGGCTTESMAKTEEFLARKVVGFAIQKRWRGTQ